jgi:hypothetical protein
MNAIISGGGCKRTGTKKIRVKARRCLIAAMILGIAALSFYAHFSFYGFAPSVLVASISLALFIWEKPSDVGIYEHTRHDHGKLYSHMGRKIKDREQSDQCDALNTHPPADAGEGAATKHAPALKRADERG